MKDGSKPFSFDFEPLLTKVELKRTHKIVSRMADIILEEFENAKNILKI